MKALKTVGMVVAAVALVATGVGIAAGGAAAAAAGSATAATAMSIASYAGLASMAISVGSALFAPKPNFQGGGDPQRFQTNPQSGLPYCIGRTAMSGLRIHADTGRTPGYTKDDDILGFAVLLSAGGQIQQIEQFTADSEVVAFDGGGQAVGRYASWMGQKISTGTVGAAALALSLNGCAMPGWTSAHKLSGMTHALWMVRHDSKGNYYSAGVPEPRWVGKWVRVYDPRLDSTYPGGSGSCRALDEATYVWSRNPALHALTWALGRWQNGKRTVGIGAPVSTIRVADFVEAANVADANGWGCGGVEWSTDSKWQALKRMLQAGGAVPTKTGAMIGCRVFTPRVSVATITRAHLLDGLSYEATRPRRDRINSIIPRYRSEEHEWEIVSGAPVTVAAYVTADGGLRRKELDLPLVQNEVGQGYDGAAQAGSLAAYEIVNAREAGPIRFTTGPQWLGLKCGDCITFDVPEEGFSAAKLLIVEPPQFDPATGKISFVADTETDSKHAFALGQSSAPPPAFALSPPDLAPATPASGLWSLTAWTGADGLPLLRVAAATHAAEWESVQIEYRKVGAADWLSGGLHRDNGAVSVEIGGVDGSAAYEARVAHRGAGGVSAWRALGSVTTPANGIPALLPLGANQAVNSEFAVDLAGWDGSLATSFPGGYCDFARNWGGVYGGNPINLACLLYDYTGVTPPAVGSRWVLGPRQKGFDGNLADLRRYALPVKAGDRVYGRGLMALVRGVNAYARVRFWTEAGVFAGEFDSAQVPGDGTLGAPSGNPATRANLTECDVFGVAPADGFAVFGTWGIPVPGGGYPDFYIFLGQPMLAKVAPGQTVAPPYTPGPGDRAADRTADNTAANTAAVGAAGASTVVAGVTAANNGLDAGGNVLTNKVSTGSVQDGAMSAEAAAFSPAAAAAGRPGWALMQSISFTSTGKQVWLQFTAAPAHTNTVYFNVQVKRNGSVIWTSGTYGGPGNGSTYSLAFAITDTPAAGAVSYEVEANYGTPNGGTLVLSDRSLIALELKK